MVKTKSKTEISSSYIYICRSPILKGCCKIGYHRGTPYQLYKRYQTALTNKVFFFLFETNGHRLSFHYIGLKQTRRIESELRNVIDVVMWKHQSHFLIHFFFNYIFLFYFVFFLFPLLA